MRREVFVAEENGLPMEHEFDSWAKAFTDRTYEDNLVRYIPVDLFTELIAAAQAVCIAYDEDRGLHVPMGRLSKAVEKAAGLHCAT